ncbi:hypothetical protein IVB03_39455 [Bradyrhizobium sp. 168]|uniref:hypothetical protein n=1 Tax=Bradyrhizobium sp. 168 TaxID=2782639 RepID=UPI001FFB77DC|nr:hypothetical protein [Bradyrhizobium sp. 168]MCK1585473.1 hypothetical protein [Bradyrhizobium sp. 168]
MSALQKITEQALKAPPPDKKKPIPKKVRHALNLMFRGECRDIKAAAEQAKLSREHLSRSLRMPHVQAFIASESRKTIAQHAIRAAARMGELVDASSEHVSLDASKHVLAIEGIRPPDQSQVNVNVGVSVGYVIDLTAGQAQPPTIDVTRD